MLDITIGPVGKISKGHVLDVNEKAFERTLQHYDPMLYIKWNPKKMRGHGCWEIRRKAAHKTVRDIYDMGDYFIVDIDYKENNIISHVLDCAFLNYDALRKIQEMDTWEKDHWIHDIEGHEQRAQDEIQRKALEELRYAVRYNRKAMRELQELVRSGKSPAEVLLGGQKYT